VAVKIATCGSRAGQCADRGPSTAFLKTLPKGKLSDRGDFKHYGLDHDARIKAWPQAMGEGGRLRDELAAFIERPDLSRLRAI
jgi:hypothetical protein